MPTEAQQPDTFSIKPFDPNSQDRTAFSCGVSQIDNYLQLTAKKNSKADMVKIWAALDGRSRIVGFYGINMHAVAVDEMPSAYRKKAPRHGLLPAAFIAMMGVDRTRQGQGLGGVLLADALNRIGRVAEEIGTAAVLLDITNDGDKHAIERRCRYYKSFGFTALPDQPLRLFIPIQTVRELSG